MFFDLMLQDMRRRHSPSPKAVLTQRVMRTFLTSVTEAREVFSLASVALYWVDN